MKDRVDVIGAGSGLCTIRGTGIDGLCYPTSDNPLILCNDVFQNKEGNYSPEIGDRTGQDGNVSPNPLFVRGCSLAQLSTGHQLQSVCVDAGVGGSGILHTGGGQ